MKNKSTRKYANGLEESHFFRTAPQTRIFCTKVNFSICGAEINSSESSLGINNLSYFQQLFQVIQICNYYISVAGE